MSQGAISQLERIATAFGYEKAWSPPSDDSRWYFERPADNQPGFLTVVLVDDFIEMILNGSIVFGRKTFPPSPLTTPETRAEIARIEKLHALPQDLPEEGQLAVAPEMIQDIRARIAKGVTTYGSVLKTYNGRNALIDAYQEALDLALYLKQALMEQEGQK